MSTQNGLRVVRQEAEEVSWQVVRVFGFRDVAESEVSHSTARHPSGADDFVDPRLEIQRVYHPSPARPLR